MYVRSLLSTLRWSAASSLQRRNSLLSDREPAVSFTFDDFPRSALEVGGSILRSYEAHGTYYAAMGLAGGSGKAGGLFQADDLKQLLSEGHELGSHTFSHLSCRNARLNTFLADVAKGREAISEFNGSSAPHHFCYPFGHFRAPLISWVRRGMASCRCTVHGINLSPINLGLLLANPLYSGQIDFARIEHLMQLNVVKRGWLIFYTHDVRDRPSPVGCTPKDFEKVVRLAARTRARILSVNRAMTALGLTPGANRPCLIGCAL